MRKKQFLQFRRAMATLLAVAMIGQNTVMTTAENYVADNTAVVAEEQAQEPEVQVEESASPAVQESAPAAETPAEPAAQAVAETPAEPAAQAVAETPAEPAAQAVAETPAEPAAQAVAETPAEPVAQAVAETPETPAEQEPSVSAETSSGSASQEPAADADKASAAEAEIDGNTVPAENPSPELGKEVLYRITFNGDAAAHGTIQVKGETAPVDVASYNKEVKENEKFEFSITAAQGYETERVTLEADGTQLVKNAEGFYEIPAVTKAENILVTYKEIPQEPAANTGSTEESEEEPAEEPIEENTDELEMPVFDYSGSCAGVTAAIYAEEGVLPEGTTVELAPLSDAQIAAAVSVLGCEVSDILGLDITFIYNGEEIQPSGNVAVSFTAAEIADVDVTSVYHVGDDGAVNEVAASQEGSSLGFTTDSFSGYLVNLAGLNGQPSETAITGNTTVAVGETITLTGSRNTNCSYEQKWESTDSSKAVIFKAKGNSAEVTGIEEGKVTITHTYCSKWKKNHWPHQENSESIEVTVTAPVYATELSLPETVSVERGSTVTITPISLKPENATLTWKSDNSAVATVDSKGIVTGKKPGTATISAQSGDRIATTTVTVKAISGGSDNTGKSWSDVEFYYLKTPTSDKNSNSVDQWGSCLGIGSIDLTGATWDANNKNTFDNVPARVITWPSGGTGSTYTVTKNSAAWKEILKYWKTQIQNNLEVEITDDDIESITLTPYKISRNEKYHVDCTIDIKCKRVVTAKYFLWDAGTNVTQYDQVYAKSFVINKGTTQPSDSDKLSLPLAKTVDGKNYTLKAWYSNSSLQGETVTFPYSIGESNVNFYAKYVRSDIKYTVNYYWNGTTEKVADSVTGFGGEPGNVITETPKMINGYTPVSYEKKQLVISENGTNEINFYYFKNVELTANSATATYDGKEHSVSGYTGVPEGVSFAGITVGATGTNAGEYPAAFAKGTVGMTDGTGKYIVSKAIDGKLEIGKAAVTLKSATLSKKYDGNALVNGDTALEIESGFAEGEGATYNFTGSQTVVGSSANAFSYELNGNTNIDNYEISKQEGTLTVTNREAKYEITVKANSATATYDGKEHEAVGVETYEFTVEGNSYTVSGLSTEDPKQKDAGSYTNNITGTPVVTDKEGNVVTSEFEVKTENGSLEIGKAAVTLKSATLSKKYDGNALVNGDTALEIESGFAEGEGATYNFTGSQTVVGSSANAFSYELNGNTNIDNYEISKQEGTLTVTNREAKYEITVKANSATATYDGKEHEAVGVETYEFTVEGNSYTVSGLSTEDPKQKDAGSYTNNITGTPVVTDKEGNVVTSEFEVKTENGSLTITPRQVNLTSESASKPYDGTPLTRPSVTGGDGFVAGEVTDIRATGSVTNVSEGEVTNTITYTTGEKFNADNYNITPEEGKLSITASQEKVTVTITGHTNTEKYDGTPKKAEGYDVDITSGGNLYKKADFSFSGTAEVEKTDAAETAYPMGLAAGQFTNTNTNFANVEFVVTDGALTITPRQVILTSATDEKVYDGTPLTNHNVTVSGDGFAAGEGVAYDVTGTQTDKGSSDNTFTYKLNEDTKASNYNIEIAVGKLTVKESEKTVVVTIKGNTDGKTYDGTEHSVSGYQVESIKIGENDTNLYTENDFEFSGKAEAKGTNAGTYPMGLKEAQFTNKNGNFTSVVFVVTDGKLEISPRQVTLTSESANKPYDGTALTRPNVTGGDGFVAGEVTDIRATGSVTNVSEGEVTNTITYTTGEKFNADNYNITPEEGKLSITASQEKVTVTITGHTNTEKYDGTPKKAEGYDVDITSGGNLYKKADFSFSGTAEVEKTDAAETAYPMGLAAGQFTNTNTNFANVEFVVTDGALTITPRQVILTSATDEKVYDGTPLTNYNVTVSGDGFAAGEGAAYEVTGTQTDKGSSDNTFTYKLNENTKASNYSIELAPGELTVTPVTDKVTVTITEHSASLKYNGAEQSVTGYDTAIDNTLYKETDFTFSGDATAKGTDFGSYPMNLKAEDFTNKNKNFANVVFEIVDGQLEITKRDVELISGSDEKVYDGTPLTKNHILIAGDQFVPGEGADYDVTGSQTNAGSSDNEFTYRLNSSTKAINYNIKTTPGTLKVTPVTDNVIVTITEHSGSAKYDGTEKTVTGYDVAIDNELYTENDFTFSGNDVIKATDADIYNMELKPSDFNNISHNFASVTFKIVDGTLNISRRDVTLTSATDSKTYDGKPLTNDNVAVGGDGFAEGEGAVYNVTGSQTEAGFSNNTFSYELKDNTKTDNYNITSFEGILTVSSSEDEVVVTITGNKDTQKYDGTEKTVEGYTVSITSPLYKESDFTFDGTALVKGTNADTYMMGLSEENFTNTNKNFAKVTFHVIDGSLVIEKRNLVLTSASAQKVYNGTELTAKDVTVSGDGFVKGEGASYDVTGTQTTVGDSENTFTYKLNENTNADNYTIETKNGSLLVTPVTDQVVVTLKENSGTEVYDGTEKTVTGYTVADISNKLYTDKDFTFTGNAEVKGTDAGTYDMELKAEDFQNINPNFTNVVFKVEDGALEITRRQVTFQADSGEKKYDGEELAVPTWKLEDGTLADGQQEIAHVEGSQTLVGESENKITDLKIFANAASQKAEGSETEAQDVTKNYSIILLAGLLKVTDGSEEDPVDPGQVVTKIHEDKTYDLDETVTFTINVKNIYDEAKTVRIIELPGVVIEGAPQETPNVLTVEKVPAGETVTATATYKITEADIANGSFVNTVKVEFEGGKPFENTDTVTTVDPVRSYTLTKKSSESIHENGMFKAGETIHYTLTVTNTGNQTLENVEITDTLNAAGTISNIQGADSKQDGKVTIFTISSLAPKTEATITYDYVVQEADKGNTISNAAVGTPANPEDPDGEKPGDNTDNPVENPKLEVKKDIVSITAADGTQKDKAGKADLNDIITYSVTVTNTGNMKLTNVKITDSLEGIQLAEGQSFDLGILEAGEAKTVTYTYQVKESDLGKSILNTATATGDVPEDPADTPKPEGKDEKEVPTEDPANCSITVTKRLTNIQGELLAVRAADFYVTLFSDEAMTQKAADTKMIHFDENQGTSSVTFDQLKRGTYYVAETDAEGKVVAEGTYNNGSYVAQYQAGNKVEITENGTAAQFQFDNQFLLLPDEYYIVKTITINKTVVKKNGEDLKSEETFYAGIFKDEDCTQLADGVSQNIVPLVMDGESTATAKTEVTVPVGGEEIKLYVTEVTADGTPVALNETFEYDVEINDGFVTLSETSEDATVLIINTSRKEEPEPTAEPAQEPTEAPAEPTQAPQVTQQPEDRAVTTNGVKTGDDSPLTQLAFMLFAASAAILLIIFLKKKDEKDIMK